MPEIRILSFGGGVQTTALAVMLVQGNIDPVDAVVFCDTGGETPETYRHVEIVEAYLQEHAQRFARVAFKGETLEDYTLHRSTPIPIRTAKSFGHRQCTNKWKIEPVKQFARAEGADAMKMVLGISWDEVQRMKPDREKWVRRSYPLIDKRITRSECRQITADAGLPDAPKSACFYCPLQGGDRWRWLAVEHPDLFERSVALETAINARRDDPAYLTGNLIPLREVARAGAMLPGFAAEECEGVCFT